MIIPKCKKNCRILQQDFLNFLAEQMNPENELNLANLHIGIELFREIEKRDKNGFIPGYMIGGGI